MRGLRSPILAVAWGTLRGFARDRVFYAGLLFSILLVAFSYSLSTLTYLEELKVLFDFGFTAISFSGILLAIFVGIVSLSKEIENKTIYTVLSKPVYRMEYILGKYLGCSLVVLAVHVMMSLAFMGIVWLVGASMPPGVFACFYLMVLESLFILSIALFSSIFSSSVLATSFTLVLFLIGRSEYFFKTISDRAEGWERLVFRALYDLFPNLERFNLRDLVAYSKPYPEDLLFWSSFYALAYIGFFLSLGMVCFMKRDLP